ncbi:G-protein coupled receptor Mth2-like [Prorops nasuta]|uniref:G-protein coupled receptor Mth2-like n=1 Tax=Prorops nasuta TaxID=863751 RepID=UPI0034CD8D8E
MSAVSAPVAKPKSFFDNPVSRETLTKMLIYCKVWSIFYCFCFVAVSVIGSKLSSETSEENGRQLYVDTPFEANTSNGKWATLRRDLDYTGVIRAISFKEIHGATTLNRTSSNENSPKGNFEKDLSSEANVEKRIFRNKLYRWLSARRTDINLTIAKDPFSLGNSTQDLMEENFKAEAAPERKHFRNRLHRSLYDLSSAYRTNINLTILHDPISVGNSTTGAANLERKILRNRFYQFSNDSSLTFRTEINPTIADESIINDSFKTEISAKNEVSEEKQIYSSLNDPFLVYQTEINSTIEEDRISIETSVQDSLILPPKESCLAKGCIPLCCPPNHKVTQDRCIPSNEIWQFPPVHSTNFTLTNLTVHSDYFQFFTWNPCQGEQRYDLNPDEFPDDKFFLLENGSVFQTSFKYMVDYSRYCFGAVGNNSRKYHVIMCFDDEIPPGVVVPEDDNLIIKFDFPIGMIISVPFLLVTFLVYTLIPDLRNMHGNTLRCYIGPLIVAYISLAVLQITPPAQMSDIACLFIAFIIHFSFLSSFFWLNVMCFDIWWTFGGFRSLQGTMKQRERKKFTLYSIYAWGCATILTGICIIMDFLPNVPDHFIRPQFGIQSCWFTTDAAKAIYFYGPMGITVICNICLFISTAIKIGKHKKDTAHHLKSSESRRHDDNKQWFNLYLKLFIVMGINWSMEIISWLCKGEPPYIWYITDLANSLQGLIIFVIFVWKDKIKRLLLKKFGCHNNGVLSRNSTRSVYNSTASRTCTTSIPLQEKVNPYVHESYRNKASPDDSDCA